jgi:4-amino-4-deoxy-L-arabinose transferase-like glycosyltransferase
VHRAILFALAFCLHAVSATALTVRTDDLWVENPKCPEGWRLRELDDSSWQAVPHPWTRIWPIDWPFDSEARPLWGTAVRQVNCLRRSFTLEAVPSDPATLHIWVDDDYELYLNGIPVGSSSDFMGELPGETYDVTPLLRAGENVIGVRVRDTGGVMGMLLSLQIPSLPDHAVSALDRMKALGPWFRFLAVITGVAIFVFVLRRALRAVAPVLERLPVPVMIAATVVLATAGQSAFGLGVLYRSHREMPLANWSWPIVGASVLLLVALAIVRARPDASLQPEPRVAREGWWLAGIVLLALALRTYQLDSVPPGFFQDEATNGNDALTLGNLSGFAIWSDSVGGRPTLFLYLLLAALKLFGVSYLTLKIVPVTLGVAGVVALYALARLTFGPRTALWAAFLFAVSRWDIHYSRMAWEAICIPAFAAAGCALLIDGLRPIRRAPLSIMAAAIVLAGGLYTYAAYRAIPSVVVVFLLVTLVFGDRRLLRQALPSLAVGGIAAILVITPLILFAWEQPDLYWYRYAEVSLTRYITYYNVPTAWLHQFGKGLLALTSVGDEIARHNLPWEPHLDRLTGGLMLVGMATALSVRRHLGVRLVWCWLLTFTAFACLTMDGPHATRLLGVAPAAILFAAFGTTQLLQQVRRVWQRAGALLVGTALAAAITAVNGYQYFVLEANHPAADFEYDVTGRSVCEYLRRRQVVVDVHWTGEVAYWSDGQCQFLARGNYNLGDPIMLDDVLPGSRFEDPGRPTVLFIGPEFLARHRDSIPTDRRGTPRLSLPVQPLVARDRQGNLLYYLYAIGLPPSPAQG